MIWHRDTRLNRAVCVILAVLFDQVPCVHLCVFLFLE